MLKVVFGRFWLIFFKCWIVSVSRHSSSSTIKWVYFVYVSFRKMRQKILGLGLLVGSAVSIVAIVGESSWKWGSLKSEQCTNLCNLWKYCLFWGISVISKCAGNLKYFSKIMRLSTMATMPQRLHSNTNTLP